LGYLFFHDASLIIAATQHVALRADTAMATDCFEERFNIDGQPMRARVYGNCRAQLAMPLVLHLHGGAFVGGSIETASRIPTLLAEAGAVVISADYPLAPAHHFPQALEAVFGLLGVLQQSRHEWAGKKSGLFVAGEEAGGNLAAGLALMARDQQVALAGQILLSPMLDACMATRSIRLAEAGPVGCQWADGWHQYLGSAEKAAHPYAAPLGSSRLAGVAPALIVTAQDDPMRDESLAYARRLRESGVVVHDHIVSAPTRWPCALNDAADAVPPWSAAVRDRFKQFFTGTRAPRSASSPSVFANARSSS
jgi:acetyl esterase